jgi:hypothetical protein
MSRHSTTSFNSSDKGIRSNAEKSNKQRTRIAGPKWVPLVW